MNLGHSITESEERRYSVETLHRVAAVAAELQATHRETLTAGEIEQIGAEAGLDPAMMRRALEIVTSEERQAQRKTPLRRRFSASFLTVAAIWGSLAFLFAQQAGAHETRAFTVILWPLIGAIVAGATSKGSARKTFLSGALVPPATIFATALVLGLSGLDTWVVPILALAMSGAAGLAALGTSGLRKWMAEEAPVKDGRPETDHLNSVQ